MERRTRLPHDQALPGTLSARETPKLLSRRNTKEVSVQSDNLLTEVSSTRNKLKSMKRKTTERATTPATPQVEMNVPPVKAPKAKVLTDKLPTTPTVDIDQPDFGKPVSWREQLQALREQQDRLRRAEKEQDYARININSKGPIGIVLTSDWHMGSNGTDYNTWERHMKMIKDEPNAFMIPLSNTIDNFIFPSGMFEQMIHPAQQAEMVKDFAGEYADKILAVVGSRCHEGWTKKDTGIEINKLIFQDNLATGVPWMPTGGVIEINLNGISYKIGARHKARGGATVNAAQKLHDTMLPVDIMAVAHNHTKEVLHATKYEGEFQKPIVYVRTGAYKIRDAYSEGEGYGQGHVGSPMVVLMPDRKHFIPFYNLEDGMEYLRVMRELTTNK